MQGVGTFATVEVVIAKIPMEDIVTIITVQPIIAFTAEQMVCSCSSIQGVVTFAAIQTVAFGIGIQVIVTLRTLLYQLFYCCHRQNSTVVESNGIDLIISGCIILEIILYRYPVAPFFGSNHQIHRAAGEYKVRLLESASKADGVITVCGRIIVIHSVLAEPFGKDISIVARTAAEVVVTCATDQGVVTITTIKGNISTIV